MQGNKRNYRNYEQKIVKYTDLKIKNYYGGRREELNFIIHKVLSKLFIKKGEYKNAKK